ncbi:MAG: hypothetical protein WBP81_27280 [Solirubrobacteraceae bacterium]
MDPDVRSAFDAFDPHIFNNMTLALDRYFVHRIRMVTGKDGNQLNEVELISDSLMNNDGVVRGIPAATCVQDVARSEIPRVQGSLTLWLVRRSVPCRIVYPL